MAERKLPRLITVAGSAVLVWGALVGCSQDSTLGKNEPVITPAPTSVRPTTLTPTPRIETPTVTVLPSPTRENSLVNRALQLDGIRDSVEYDGEKYNFELPLRIDARIKLNESRLGGDAIVAKGLNDAIAFFASLTSCPERGMALIVNGKDPVCGPKIQGEIWKDVSAAYDGKTVIFYENGAEVGRKPWEGSVPIEKGKLYIGKSPSGVITQEYFGGLIDGISISRGNQVLFKADYNSDFNDRVTGTIGNTIGGAKLVSAE